MSTEYNATIDLSKYSARVYTGRSNGQAAREKFGVDEKSRSHDRIKVLVPDDAKTLNSSFLLGLFGHLIVQSGSGHAFRAKFNFKMPKRYDKQLELAIKRALFNKNNDPALI